ATYRSALSYVAEPAQNCAFADNSGNIAITANGLFPLKEKRQGKYLLDGSLPDEEWKQRIPFTHNPTVKNPKRGFVSSANQWPVDSSYPYYLGWEFAPHERGHRINQLLMEASAQTADDFILMQNDNFSVLAENVLPLLLESLSASTDFSTAELAALKTLKSWNYHYNADEKAATIFESWYYNLQRKIWSDEFNSGPTLMHFPALGLALRLALRDSERAWYANDQKDFRRAQLALVSFQETIQALTRQHGEINNSQWSKVRKAHFPRQ